VIYNCQNSSADKSTELSPVAVSCGYTLIAAFKNREEEEEKQGKNCRNPTGKIKTCRRLERSTREASSFMVMRSRAASAVS
jgi:hypothetical protein